MKFLCYLLVIICTILKCEGGITPNGVFALGEKINGLTYIGGENSLALGPTQGSYFSTTTEVKWEVAQSMCTHTLGANAHLIRLESMGEADLLAQLLRNTSSALYNYWTDGRYSENLQGYSWDDEGPTVEPSLWGEDEPFILEPEGRLAMMDGVQGFKAHSKLANETYGFICELPWDSRDTPLTCRTTSDLVIVMDASYYVSSSQFLQEKRLISDMAIDWTGWNYNGSQTNTRLALTAYGHTYDLKFELNEKLSERDILSWINGATQYNDNSNVYLYLSLRETLNQLINNNNTNLVNPKHVLVLSAGVSINTNYSRVLAEQLREVGARVFAVGLGSYMGDELYQIATDPSFVYAEQDFASLRHLLVPLQLMPCATERIFFSKNDATDWSSSQEHCSQALAPDAKLLNLHSKDDVSRIAELLEEGDSLSYWTSGKYNSTLEKYVWSDGQEINEELWDVDEPSVRNESGRIALMKEDNGLKVRSKTEETNYHTFCELVWTVAGGRMPVYTNDLVLVIDASSNVDQSSMYPQVKDFAFQVGTAWTGWNYEGGMPSRISFLIYSSSVQVKFELDNELSDREIADEISNVNYIGSSAQAHLALEAALTQFETHDIPNGIVSRNVVFVTGGDSANSNFTIVTAKRLHELGVRLFGVHFGAEPEELKDIVSHSSFLFRGAQFAELKQAMQPMKLLGGEEKK